MKSLEQEFKEFLTSRGLPFEDNSSTFEKLDFTITGPEPGDKIEVELKEKRQAINAASWGIHPAREQHVFILDDLAARKILHYAPRSGLITRNNLDSYYYWFSVVDLFLMPKERVNRPIAKAVRTFKGKWIIDLRNGKKCSTLEETFQAIKGFIGNLDDIFIHHLECYGTYQGERVRRAGQVRRPDHWQLDVDKTR